MKIKPNTEMTISIKRNGEVQKKVITSTTSVVAANGGLDTIGAIGVYPEMIYSEMSLQEALLTGLLRTVGSFTMIIESLRMIGSGQASVKDLGGPIMIAQLAGQTAEAGFIPFLTFMALLSVNLAFLNILPIPGLDGGHIFIHCIESLIRKPLTLKTRIIIQQLGMAFLLVLMVTIIFQDITRLFN